MNKYEIVEEMKKNDRGFFALSDEEKAVMEVARKADSLVFRYTSEWIKASATKTCGGGITYRICESYQLPQEIPDGYRIATDEERNDFAYPTDCDVKWIFSKHLYNNYAIRDSHSDTGWGYDPHRKVDDLLTFYIPKDYIFDERITDEYLQNIDTPLCVLPEKVQAALEERYNNKGGLDSNIEYKDNNGDFVKHINYPCRILFNKKDTLRLAKPDPKPRYVEFDIIPKDGVYMVNSGATREEDRPRRHYDFVRLSKIFDIVGFAGVRFEGQKSSGWSMKITGFINKHGSVTLQSVDQTNSAPATPIKARFLIGAK